MDQSTQNNKKCLVSACLIGLHTRYDGASKPSAACEARLAGLCFIPVCPEQLGGLCTPRAPATLAGGDGDAVLEGRAKVLTREGRDVTGPFIQGATECLAIARICNCEIALLKARSPSCGCLPQPGVTAALLRRNGIEVIEID